MSLKLVASFVSILAAGSIVLACSGADTGPAGESPAARAHSLDVPVADDDPAAPAPSRFACGTTGCTPQTQYCRITMGGYRRPDGGTPVSYACAAVPVACTTDVSCACLKHGPGTCTEADGNVTVTIYAP